MREPTPEEDEPAGSDGDKITLHSDHSKTGSSKRQKAWANNEGKADASNDNDDDVVDGLDLDKVDPEAAKIISLLGRTTTKKWLVGEDRAKKKSQTATQKDLIRQLSPKLLVQNSRDLQLNEEERARNETNELRFKRAKSRLAKDWYKDELNGSWAKRVLLSDKFDFLIMSTIIVNAMWIGYELEARDDGLEESGGYDIFGLSYFVLMEYVFLVIFSFELLVRFGAYKWPWYYFADPHMIKWNLFDLLLVGLMWAEFLMTYLAPEIDTDMGLFSVLRLARLLRLSKLMRMLPELEMMVFAVWRSLRSVSTALFLLIMLGYVFANIFTQWAKDKLESGEMPPDEHDLLLLWYGNLGHSLLTLGQIAIKETVFVTVRQTLDWSLTMGIMLLLWMWMTVLGIFNLLIAVICEVVYNVKDSTHLSRDMDRILECFDIIDVDGNGRISIDEFMEKGYTLMSLGLNRQQCVNAFMLANPDCKEEIALQELEIVICKLIHDPKPHDILIANKNIQSLCSFMGIVGALTAAGKVDSPADVFRDNMMGTEDDEKMSKEVEESAELFTKDDSQAEQQFKLEVNKRFSAFETRILQKFNAPTNFRLSTV